MALDLKFFLYP